LKGTLAVSRNASKHGILSPKPVVAHFESEDGWETHRQSILDSLDPQGGIEQALAERVALNSWRLNRVIFYETEQISKLQEEALEDATQLSSLSYSGKDAASLFKDVEEKRGILADIERLFKGGDKDLSSPATSEFIYTEASFNVALYRAVQDLQAKRGDVEDFELGELEDDEGVHKHAAELSEVILEVAYPLRTTAQVREGIELAVEKAGYKGMMQVDGGHSNPVEYILERLYTDAEQQLKWAQERAAGVEERVRNYRRMRILPQEHDLQKISRYEAHLSREMYKALHELEALQTRRQGGAAPLARFDVQTP